MHASVIIAASSCVGQLGSPSAHMCGCAGLPSPLSLILSHTAGRQGAEASNSWYEMVAAVVVVQGLRPCRGSGGSAVPVCSLAASVQHAGQPAACVPCRVATRCCQAGRQAPAQTDRQEFPDFLTVHQLAVGHSYLQAARLFSKWDGGLPPVVGDQGRSGLMPDRRHTH